MAKHLGSFIPWIPFLLGLFLYFLLSYLDSESDFGNPSFNHPTYSLLSQKKKKIETNPLESISILLARTASKKEIHNFWKDFNYLRKFINSPFPTSWFSFEIIWVLFTHDIQVLSFLAEKTGAKLPLEKGQKLETMKTWKLTLQAPATKFIVLLLSTTY